jgi:hypothetical protein
MDSSTGSSATPTADTTKSSSAKPALKAVGGRGDDHASLSSQVGEIKPKPIVQDSRKAKMMEQVTEQLERKLLKKEKAQEMGLGPDGEEMEVPPEVPKLAFVVGANVLSCPKFELTDSEANLMSKCLTILFPRIQSKVYAVIVIVSITAYKLSACTEAIRSKFKNLKFGFKKPGSNAKYDEKRQAVKHA